MSELIRQMYASRAPFTHLRPYPDVPPPLVLPVSDPSPDGSRQVQLWHSVSTSPALAHLVAQGGVPLKLEPFPGEGPHHGELAINWGDVFKEVRVASRIGSETVYVHLGRADDQIRLGVSGMANINASAYEFQLRSAIESHLGGRSGTCGDRWILDAVQLFGSNRPCTSLVVQLRPSSQEEGSGLNEDLLQKLCSSVEEVNEKLKLGPRIRVHHGKRMLVLTSDSVHGPGAERLQGEFPRLMVTHKRTLQRWRNVQTFKPWLEGLDYSEL
jgi:hypothetical protein